MKNRERSHSIETMKRADISNQVLLKLDNITIRVRDKLILCDTTWQIKKNQHWAVLGPNGSGKTSLVRVLTGEVPVVKGSIIRSNPESAPDSIGYVSLELHQQVIAREEDRDEARFFSGEVDNFTKAGHVILAANPKIDAQQPDFARVTRLLGIGHLLDRGIRFLSTGEMRKILIARALMKSPELLILDEPFEGLDRHSRELLTKTIIDLMNQQITIILVTHRFEEIIPDISHFLCLKDCSVFLQGSRDEVLTGKNMSCLYDKQAVSFFLPGSEDNWEPPKKDRTSVIVEFRNTTVKYGALPVLDNLNWTMKRGENWAIVGPNGSGKSTLLSLIIGDNPQAYANEIHLFGKRRGTGESIWEIKKRVGLVSSELQVNYRKRMRVYDVVLSGFHDSIGLYRTSSNAQHRVAQHWMKVLDITDKANLWFDQLSYGQKRMVLLARSMVKLPPLLVLDEPCQGLDLSNRTIVLDIVDYIGRETETDILYVTHYQDEIPPCVTNVLRLEKPQQPLFG